MNLRHTLAHIVIVFFILISTSSAQIYDWVLMGRDDIQVIEDPSVEAQLRIQMIRQAKNSIDLITFDQRSDNEIGIPILEALEEAALKGVKIRFAMTCLISTIKDPEGIVPTYLKKIASEAINFQYNFVGGNVMKHHGWKFMDATHEKLMVIDNNWAVTTGRGQGEQYLHWLDTGFVFKGPLVTQSKVAFEHLWSSIIRENPYKTQLPKQTPNFSGDLKNISIPENTLTLPLNPNQITELKFLTQWLLKPASNGREYRARVLHYDFLDQMRNLPEVQNKKAKPSDYDLDSRIKLLHDPVVEESIALLKTAKTFKFHTLSVSLHPNLKNAILSKLRLSSQLGQDFQLEVFTNSKKSHKNIMSLAIGWYAGLKDLDDLLWGFDHSKGFLLADNKVPDDPTYLHRKLIIIEQDPSQANGHEDSVIFGSHNLSYSSTATLDEMSFEIESSDFASRMNKVFQNSISLHGQVIDKAKLHHQRLKHRASQWISSYLKWIF